MKSASNGGIHKGRLQCFMYMYFLLPHWGLAIWRSRAQTSMRAELPSRKLPTTRVRRRISRFSRSMTLMGDFTHPWVGQAERLACRKRQPTQFPGGSPDPLYCQRKEKLGPGRAGSAIPPCVAPVRLRVRRLGAGQPCTNKRRHKATVRPLWAKGGNRKLVPRELRIFHF